MMKPNSIIRILVADPHPIVCEGLASMLSQQPDMACVGQANSGQETLSRFNELRPNVLVTEIDFPDMDGISLLTNIFIQFPSPCILVLTSRTGDETIYQALHAGAKGYYCKDVSLEALTQAIRTIHSGQSTLAQHVAMTLAIRVQTIDLTPREREILLHIAQGQSNQEIARALFIAEGTVKAHINNIFVKLNVSDRTQAVLLAIRRGLVPAP